MSISPPLTVRSPASVNPPPLEKSVPEFPIFVIKLLFIFSVPFIVSPDSLTQTSSIAPELILVIPLPSP